MMHTMYDPLSGNMYGFDDSVITNMIATSCYSKSEIDTKLAAVLKLCGSKESYSQLPKSGNEVGDVWIVLDEHAEYAWVKSNEWEELGPVINLDPYATQDWTRSLVGTVPNGYQNVTAYIAAVATVANSAKKSGDDAKTTVDNFKTAQLVFEAATESIAALVNPVAQKEETTDTNFSRHKTYYKLVGAEYVTLIIGVDYEAMDSISDFGETVYEEVTPSLSTSTLVNKINELITAGNALIAAHKQTAVVEEVA